MSKITILIYHKTTPEPWSDVLEPLNERQVNNMHDINYSFQKDLNLHSVFDEFEIFINMPSFRPNKLTKSNTC